MRVTAFDGSAGRTIVGISVACETAVTRPRAARTASVSSTFAVKSRLLVSRMSDAINDCASLRHSRPHALDHRPQRDDRRDADGDADEEEQQPLP